MNTKRLLIALLIATVISGGFTYWLSRRLVRHSTNTAQLHYVSATRKLEMGEAIAAGDLRIISWPISARLDGAFERPEDLVGRTVAHSVASGQPILDSELIPAGANAGLSAHIPQGMRAVSLKSDQVVGVAGYLLPGTHVDVLVTLRAPSATDPVTTTVLQDAQILTAGQKMQPDPEGKATTVDVVTLLVTPDQAERVVLASSQGSVHFVLRNGLDHGVIADSSTRMSELAGGKPTAPVMAAAIRKPAVMVSPSPKKAYSVEVMRGEKQTVENF